MTRFYFPSTGSPAVSPAFAAGWEDTASASRRACYPAPTGGGTTTDSVAEISSDGSFDVLIAQYVSAPIVAQTISGTIKGQFITRSSAAAADMRTQMVAKVVSGDGSTVRGTLVDFDASALSHEWDGTTLTNSYFPLGGSRSVTSVAAQDGDVIVFELGYRAHNTSTTSRNGRIVFRDGLANDLPEDETSTTAGAGNPWIELSHPVVFKKLTASNGSLSLTGNAAALKASRRLIAGVGSLAMTGNVAGFTASRIIAAAPASFALTGNHAALEYQVGPTFILTAGTADFSLSGSIAGLLRGRSLTATTASFAVTGQANSLTVQRKLTALAAAVTLTGNATLLNMGRRLAGVVGEFTLAGGDTALSQMRRMVTSAGAFLLSANDSALLCQRYFGVAVGSLLLSGASISFRRILAPPASRITVAPVESREAVVAGDRTATVAARSGLTASANSRVTIVGTRSTNTTVS